MVEVAAAAGAVDVGDVAAGAEGARAFALDEDERDGGVVGPGREGGVDRVHHAEAERVQRLRAGEGDAAGAAVDAGEDRRRSCGAPPAGRGR